MMPLLVQAGLLAAGAYLMSTGSLSVGTFLFAFQIGTGLSQFSQRFGEIASAWQYLRSAQDRIAEMLALGARPVTDGRMIPLPSTGLELRGVEVTSANRRFLHGLDVQVRPGELVVVSGPPGCGKTTLAGIASGLIDPDRGAASLDGIALDELDPAQLRQTISVVSEEPMLFAATLRENLLLGAWGEIDDDAMIDAMRTAGAEEVIGELGGPRRRRRRPRPHPVRRPAPAGLARARARRAAAGADPRRRALGGEPVARDRDHARVHEELPRDVDPLHHPADRARCSSPTAPSR